MTIVRNNRLSPCSRGEDEGEGLERTRLASTLTLPLSLGKGGATRHTRRHTKLQEDKRAM